MQLPEGITCVDPTQPIATLMNGDTAFNLTFILEQSTGYRVWKKPTQSYGTGFYPSPQIESVQVVHNDHAGYFLEIQRTPISPRNVEQ